MLLSQKHRPETRNRRGFTLIEVMVVAAIIVILAGGATMLYLNRLEDAKLDSSKARAKNLAHAIELYEIKNGVPNDLQDLVTAGYIEESGLLDSWNNKMSFDVSGAKPVVMFQHNGTNYSTADVN
jgi:prepilin-type N-terminal cleavage/methylation domain-containing protein